jgi:hypothetical protein
VADLLTARALNRATLDRQLLLRRHPLPAQRAVAHLAGLQAQAPLAPYLGLWTRLKNFNPEDLSTILTERTLLRAHLYRNTVHLLTAEDYLDFRPLFVQLGERGMQAHFGKRLAGVDPAELRARARQLISDRPLTRAALGKLLAEIWPDIEPTSLAYGACYLLPLIQTPPRGIWGQTGQATFALADEWLGQPVAGEPDPAAVGRLVLRCVAAFGPMTVADIQTWSGLTRLREVTERLAERLRSFRSEDGAELLDLPDAPRPDPDTPAPPRFLPEYDNLLLSHADRRRVIPHSRPVPLPPGNGCTQGTLLIDGCWNATWQITNGILDIRPFVPLSPADIDAITAEGVSLLTFADVEADIRVTPQAVHS